MMQSLFCRQKASAAPVGVSWGVFVAVERRRTDVFT
jgi:hypothetical protein